MSIGDRVASSWFESARSRGLAFACVAILAGCSGPPSDLVFVSTIDLDVQESSQPEFRKTLEAGHWLIEVREQDIDLRTVIDAPRIHAELQDVAPRHGLVVKVIDLTAPGEVHLQLRSVDHPTKRGTATVRVSRFKRDASAGAGVLEQGYTAWSAAAERQAEATPDSWSIAADKLNEAITHFENANDEAARAGAAYALATLQYSKRDDWTAAIRAAEIATDMFDEVNDQTGHHNGEVVRAAAEISLASGMNATTQRAEQKSLYDAADRRLTEAARYFGEQKLPLRSAYAANLRGMRALNLGEQDDAAAHFSHALDLSQASKDVAEQVRSTANLAWTHRLQGHIAQAAEEFRSMLGLLDPKRQTYLYGAILNNYGFCLIALGDFDRALTLHTEALDLFESLDQKDEAATQLAALGGLYFRMGDADRAIENLRLAIAAQEAVSDTRGLAGTLRVTGNVAASMGQHDMALEYLRRSVAIDTNRNDVARTRVLIAGELRAIGDLAGAEVELSEALSSPMAIVRADALTERAQLHMARKNQKGAITDLRAADTAYKELGIEFNRINTTSSLGMLLLATGDIAAASAFADEAVAIVGRLRVNSSNPEWRAWFRSAQYAPHEARIAIDVARGGEKGAWNGFRVADEVRARSLADHMVSGVRSGDSDTEAQILRLSNALNDQHLRLDARVQTQADEGGNRELRREIEETRARLEALKVRLAAGARNDARLPDSLQQMQKLLPPDTVVLAYFVGDTSSHAWLLSREQLRHVHIAERAKLQRAIDATADNAPGSPAALVHEERLSALLLGNLLDGVKESRMLVVPDGPLNGVPFAALPLGRNGNRLLLDQFVIGYAPSLSLALAPRKETRHAATRVAVISDPVYAADDRRLPTQGAGNLRNERSKSPNQLTRLPYSALEARAVIDNFGADKTTSLTGFDATTERVHQLASIDLSVLHFATHAKARKDSPERSALFLSEYTPEGELRAITQFTANDVMRTRLKADVVVLSACATGDGSTLRGEGVLGLTYSFLANGSGSVVASLWPVEDATTARLMNEFYRAYLASANAAEALRTAQLRIRGNPRAAAVWSSFVVRANGFP